MKKILVLAPFNLFPPAHGGSTTVYYLIRDISKNNRVFVLLNYLHTLRGKIDLAHQNLQIQYCPESVFNRLGAKLTLLNLHYFAKAYEIAKNFDMDVIHCEILWTAFAGIFLKNKFRKPLLLVAHNVEYLKFKSMGAPKFLTFFLKKIEGIACRSADKIAVVSKIDKDHLIKLYNIQDDRIEIISHNPDLNVFKYNEQGAEAIKRKYAIDGRSVILTFVGNLEYAPNKNAVMYISERIYPTIVKKYPYAKFIIIGQKYENVLKYKKENMIFTGYLDTSDLIAHLSASDIVLVPIDSGSGIRRKILDAAACSRAIVSTAKGAEGLSFINNKEILITSDIDSEFVKMVMKLIEDENLRQTIGENSRRKIEEKYSWEKEVDKFEKIYEEVCGV